MGSSCMLFNLVHTITAQMGGSGHTPQLWISCECSHSSACERRMMIYWSFQCGGPLHTPYCHCKVHNWCKVTFSSRTWHNLSWTSALNIFLVFGSFYPCKAKPAKGYRSPCNSFEVENLNWYQRSNRSIGLIFLKWWSASTHIKSVRC
jgi:hypothetical protein